MCDGHTNPYLKKNQVAATALIMQARHFEPPARQLRAGLRSVRMRSRRVNRSIGKDTCCPGGTLLVERTPGPAFYTVDTGEYFCFLF